MVGVSIPFSFANRSRRRISRRCAAWKIVRRVVFLFAIGIALNTFPFYLDNIAQTWRPMGVLQRIAIVYGIAAVLFVVGDRWKRARLLLTLWCVLALALWAVYRILIQNIHSCLGADVWAADSVRVLSER